MLLVFVIENGKTRCIPGVTDLHAFGDSLIIHRKNQKQPKFNTTGVDLGLMLDANFLCKRYQSIYMICHIKDCARMGVGDGLIKWIAWNGEFIAHMTESEAHRHIRTHPL